LGNTYISHTIWVTLKYRNEDRIFILYMIDW
jgi:hypothetical protein